MSDIKLMICFQPEIGQVFDLLVVDCGGGGLRGAGGAAAELPHRVAGQHRADARGRPHVRRALPLPASAQEGRLGTRPGKRALFSAVTAFDSRSDML